MENYVHVFDHPLIQHKLGIIREEHTGPKEFRELVNEIAKLMAYEITLDLPLADVSIQTPVAKTTVKRLSGKKLGIVPIMRAGLGMVDGILSLMPVAKVGHIGLYRDPETLEAVEYYAKLPEDAGERELIVVDPMLATGGSAAAAITAMKKRGAKHIKFLCLVAVREGIDRIHTEHPDVPIYTCAIDPGLNEKSYISPGFGDAGDRLFGTK
ncbi:uracil phosphoribosyltransferase [Halolactibacillus alkaliphilus]|uniref:Uracil phosphoribosyltransferase n=1 Tax=Halolactibacillus alkaliphilus TaxID=442899 RepID=A0A511X0S1_9BACI|nr:uracil phosphoribosyltransferase [Halolactibacillus alkaliphilus]GEN56546.1 uracil phosphoribosyltransferase [Halolactibacillus alkaliphilus]GGN69319.1 uracil phosphoribosyltransferase [Halolactibacillus alkaliphilus]SFO75011.1 uracil phosphoribosyltransferase [Halolactibacillus alkaliphilus]